MTSSNRKSRAIIIPFHQYHPRTAQYYRVYFDHMADQLGRFVDEFDKLYLIDDGWEFTKEDEQKLKDAGINYEIVPREKDGHHWVQFSTSLKYLEKEDNVLFLDNDVVIYKPGVIDGWFKAAEAHLDKDGNIKEGYDLTTAFDGSGGMQDVVQAAFPPLKLMGVTRMGSYYFVANKAVRDIMAETELGPVHYETGTHIDELEYVTKEGDWSDSFGLLTIKVFGKGMRVGLIGDPRDSIYWQKEDGFLRDPPEYLDLGYYHIRNGNLPCYLLTTRASDENRKDYDHAIDITPKREWLRILAWYDYMQLKLGDLYRNDIDEMLKENKMDTWEAYMNQFRKYYGL